MQRALGSFPLPSSVKLKLESKGFTSVEDLKEVGPLELSKETELSLEEAVSVIHLVFPNKNSNSRTDNASSLSINTVSLKELLECEHQHQFIITYSEKIDTILGGGISTCMLTEICGAPGIGKTQMCLQLCVDVQIPTALGGLQGQAVYLDTEGSFTAERFKELAEAAVQHCQSQMPKENSPKEEEFSVKNILNGTYLYRIHNYVELIAVVNILHEFLESNRHVKLIVVDSIAFPFRNDFDGNPSLRMHLLRTISQQMLSLAEKYKLAVILTNQLTTKFDSENGSHQVPALGDSWGHVCTTRVLLFWENSRRFAKLFKSPRLKEATVPYVIVKSGIRDAPNEV